MPFLIIFVLIPLAEVYAFITVGEEIGVLKTLLLCVLTAVIGGLLVRHQGLETLMKGRASLTHGQMPMDALFDGICIIIAGALLLTPGFVTDSIGFSLLIPPFRRFMRDIIVRYNLVKTEKYTVKKTYTQQNNDIIEGNYEKIDENDSK